MHFIHNMINMIPYKAFAKHLEDNHVTASPAELHGLASGMIVVNKDLENDAWLKLVFEDYCFDNTHTAKLVPVLTALFDYASDKLKADNYTFNLLLPSDENELSYRLDALSTWCASFLSGLAYAGLKSDANMHQDVHEFILDLENITKVETLSEGTQGEEADFIELVEYVKAGSILLFSEFNVPADNNETIQ